MKDASLLLPDGRFAATHSRYSPKAARTQLRYEMFHCSLRSIYLPPDMTLHSSAVNGLSFLTFAAIIPNPDDVESYLLSHPQGFVA